MRASEYIVDYIGEKGVDHVFGVTGGAITPLIDAFHGKDLEFVCTAQEQGAAMAAEAYSRISRNLGVAMATSGPGAINLMTGIAGAYFDSIPTLYITGQVSTLDSTYEGGPRQIGFQEADIVSMVEPITKFAQKVDDPTEIRYYLDKALHIASAGRPGPVLLDFPMNVQLEEISPEDLKSYTPERNSVNYSDLREKVNETIHLIGEAERPVMILGAGVKISGAETETRTLIERLGIPITPSWGGIDVLPHDHPLFVEGFGASHNRAGNFAVQNSDLVISLGSRLDTKQTGSKAETFARGAKKVVVDIDSGELYKDRGMKIDVGINYDVGDFVRVMLENEDSISTKDLSPWKERIKDWVERYPVCLPEYFEQEEKVNPYVFMAALSEESKEGDNIVLEIGSSEVWAMQSWKVKEGQRIFSDFGNSSMGHALPASIGASFASNKGNVTCITGDGALKMGVKELETIVTHNLPINIFVINNHEYSIIKQFQDVWFGSRYAASEVAGGLGNVDLLKVAEAYGVPTLQINNHKEMRDKIREVQEREGPIVCSVELKSGEKTIPKLEFGKPIEDLWPDLSDEELEENMIVRSIRKK